MTVDEENQPAAPKIQGFATQSRRRTVSGQRRKSDFKLEDYGVTFEQFKEQLEKQISYGYRPHFGYPALKFDSVKEGLQALNLEDSSGSPDPIMSIVNSDSIDKFHNLLLSSNKAQMHGNTLVIDKPPQSLFDQCWLYSFVQKVEKGNVQKMVDD